jgi:transposase, IS30 family
MFENIPREYKKSLTSDNGREFAYHKIISLETGMDFYFAHPYSPWERGTNENTN